MTDALLELQVATEGVEIARTRLDRALDFPNDRRELAGARRFHEACVARLAAAERAVARLTADQPSAGADAPAVAAAA